MLCLAAFAEFSSLLLVKAKGRQDIKQAVGFFFPQNNECKLSFPVHIRIVGFATKNLLCQGGVVVSVLSLRRGQAPCSPCLSALCLSPRDSRNFPSAYPRPRKSEGNVPSAAFTNHEPGIDAPLVLGRLWGESPALVFLEETNLGQNRL